MGAAQQQHGAASRGPTPLEPAGQRLRLPDGRHLAWCERGDRAGEPVFSFHGLPGSRHQAHPDDRIALRAGARMIHMDRPGFGLSDAAPSRTLTSWADDVRTLADHLGIGRFAITGISGGGPFACACLCELGERITRGALISSVGPPGTMAAAHSWMTHVIFVLARRQPRLLAPFLAASGGIAKRAPHAYLASLIARLPRADRSILASPALRAVLVRDMLEAVRQGPGGILRDLQLESSPWDLPFTRVSCPVSLWHGTRDNVVPLAAVDALAALLPHAQVRKLEGEGHFFVFARWEEILAWLLGRE